MGRLSWPLLRNFPSLTLTLVKLVQPWLPWKLLLLFPPLKFSLKGIPYPTIMAINNANLYSEWASAPIIANIFVFCLLFSLGLRPRFLGELISRHMQLLNVPFLIDVMEAFPLLFLFFLLYALRVGKTCLDPSLSPFAFSNQKKKKC
jgi:hypothetical protein